MILKAIYALFFLTPFLSAQQVIQTETPHYYILQNDVLMALQKQTTPYLKESGPRFSIVALTPKQTDELSILIHKYYGTCGGFIDIQPQLNRGASPHQLLVWMHGQPSIKRIANQYPNPQFPQHVENLFKNLDQNRMWSYLTELSSFNDRYSRGEGGVKSSQFLAQRSQELAQKFNRPDISIFTVKTGGGYTQDSVVVRIPGSNTNLPGILLGAHMDTFRNDKPGADDDGSGVASLEELYTSLLQSNLKFQRDIYFAYYAAEELGLVGSQRVVAEFKERKIPLRAILQFDMTGFKSPNDPQEIYLITDYVDQNLTVFLKKLIDTYVKVPVGQTKCGYACSDHASWYYEDYPTSFPFEASFNNDNKTIHTSGDVMNIISPLHIMNFIKLGAAFIGELAN